MSFEKAKSKALVNSSLPPPSGNIDIPRPKFVDFGLITTGRFTYFSILLILSSMLVNSSPFGTLTSFLSRIFFVTTLLFIASTVA